MGDKIKNAFKYESLVAGNVYHVYNRSNANELLFRDHGNYMFFIDKYKDYIGSIADILCFCLMPTHFHFVMRIKESSALQKHFLSKSIDDIDGSRLESLVSQQFSNFFNCYTKPFNKLYNRHGSLFSPKFKRKLVHSESYLQSLIRYVHRNPMEAGLVSDLSKWKYSSYKDILSRKNDFVRSEEVIELFEDLENFKFVHRLNSPGIDKE